MAKARERMTVDELVDLVIEEILPELTQQKDRIDLARSLGDTAARLEYSRIPLGKMIEEFRATRTASSPDRLLILILEKVQGNASDQPGQERFLHLITRAVFRNSVIPH